MDRTAVSEGVTIKVDVLILGGGIQGVWLLRDLAAAGYSVVLLDIRALGGEQTCHSHVYLHRGYNYQQTGLITALGEAHRRWVTCLNQARGLLDGPRPVLGFTNLADYTKKQAVWDDAKLRPPDTLPEVAWPSPLRNGHVKSCWSTDEEYADATVLVSALIQGFEDHTSKIEHVIDMTLSQHKRGPHTDFGVSEVKVRMPNGGTLAVQPRAVVLAAGHGNQQLMDLVARYPELKPAFANQQQVRKGHMLVVKGKLEPLCGIFSLDEAHELFIVSRQDNEDTIWLVSDNRSPALSSVEDYFGRGHVRRWLPLVLEGLKNLAPDYFKDDEKKAQWRWGVYEAPKAEGRHTGGLPTEHVILRVRSVPNVWTVWPTKLTLAPLASREIVAAIRGELKAPESSELPAQWYKVRCQLRLEKERWTQTPLIPWDDFKRCHEV